MALPELFGSYVLHRLLAASEMAEIFLAQTMGEFPRLCALKRVRSEFSSDSEFVARFRNDAGLLVRLVHGNVVQVLDVGAVEDSYFVAMEPIDGIDVRSLLDTVDTHGPVPVEAALYIVLEISEALSYLQLRRREHAQSPSFTFDHAWALDSMLSFDGAVKAISPGSFGALGLGRRPISRVFRSPGYVAPEVLLRSEIGSQTDVFVAGLLLWELLSGETLIKDAELHVRQVFEGTFQPPIVARKDVPGDVIRAVAQMLHQDPAERLSSLESVRTALVGSLRRIAPAYGSSALSRLLLKRFAKEIRAAEARNQEVLKGTTRMSVPPEGPLTQSFGRPDALTQPVTRRPIELKPGDRIPGTRYRLVRSLGRGGSAEVFAAQHVDLDRQVALKVLAPELATQAQAIAHFRLEARTCSRIGHPNIIDVIDFGELEDGRFFFAMELLPGESLAEVLRRDRTLPPERAIAIIRQIAKALQAAHEHGVIHRDLKPENVLLATRDGRGDFVKVVDFGVMAFSADAVAERVGTPGYMPPEQIKGARPDPRMDVYAIGVTLYEMLCGQLPYKGSSVDGYIAALAAGPAPALRSQRRGHHIPPALEQVVHRAIDRDPMARHASAADFEAEVLRAQQACQIISAWDDLAPPEGVQDRRAEASLGTQNTDLSPEGRSKRSSAIWWGFALSGVLLLIGIWAGKSLMRQPQKATTARNAADTAAKESDTAPYEDAELGPVRARGQIIAATAADTGVPDTGQRVDPERRADANAPDRRPRLTTKVQRKLPMKHSPKAVRIVKQGKSARVAPPAQQTDASAQPVADPPSARAIAVARKWVRRGKTLLAARKLADATVAFNHALAPGGPASADALAGLAGVAFHRARYAEAVKLARRAVAKAPQDSAAYLLLGDAYMKVQRSGLALGAWRKALELDPNSRRALARIEDYDALKERP